MNQRDQVLDEWVAADIYSCFSAAIGFSVVPSPWQAVLVSVFDTHSLLVGWHNLDCTGTDLTPSSFPVKRRGNEKMVKTHTKRQKWKEGAEER